MTYIDDPAKTPAENHVARVEAWRATKAARGPAPTPAVPPISLSRYDVCTCGLPRFMHDPIPSGCRFVLAEALTAESLADDPELSLLLSAGWLVDPPRAALAAPTPEETP